MWFGGDEIIGEVQWYSTKVTTFKSLDSYVEEYVRTIDNKSYVRKYLQDSC